MKCESRILPSSTRLRDLSLSDGVTGRLVKLTDRAPDLENDFPGVAQRHRNRPSSFWAVRRAIRNPNVEPYIITVDRSEEIYTGETDPRLQKYFGSSSPLSDQIFARTKRMACGLATIAHGLVLDGVEGVGIAGWLTEDVRHQGVGSVAGRLLVERAAILGETIHTVVRPDNVAVCRILEENHLAPVGQPRDFAEEMGDGVETDRIIYRLESGI